MVPSCSNPAHAPPRPNRDSPRRPSGRPAPLLARTASGSKNGRPSRVPLSPGRCRDPVAELRTSSSVQSSTPRHPTNSPDVASAIARTPRQWDCPSLRNSCRFVVNRSIALSASSIESAGTGRPCSVVNPVVAPDLGVGACRRHELRIISMPRTQGHSVVGEAHQRIVFIKRAHSSDPRSHLHETTGCLPRSARSCRESDVVSEVKPAAGTLLTRQWSRLLRFPTGGRVTWIYLPIFPRLKTLWRRTGRGPRRRLARTPCAHHCVAFCQVRQSLRDTFSTWVTPFQRSRSGTWKSR